ncbi:methyl-accepting chemotaxis protein [Herbaspirillum sp. RTI4]|uniref:methyl-accepting chemotaxis protein n=1 Tax=Herbaspirillum sp. RTI4 TaxID=3048640 RepID=UPI002AB41590|nr:methyl-accepting chemotaxis protein [Herbaspirillum sp. RTI4]MDY7578216.1 methyl-accepting chemotaxis protein [Herbaspirillum sp. RTI4]MEA9981554.1 methyl-accepting chemotaxis protein [Herbaspirillum sp. RTI4]
MKISNLRIGQRLTLSFSLIVALLVIIATLTFAQIGELSNSINKINNESYPKTMLAHVIKDQLNLTARNLRNLLLLSDPAKMKLESDNIINTTRIISETLDKLSLLVKSEEGRNTIANLLVLRSQFLPVRNKLIAQIALPERNRQLEQDILLNEIRPVQGAYLAGLDQLIEHESAMMTKAGTASADKARQTQYLVLILAFAAVIISGIVAWLATRSITVPLNKAVLIARKVADGDLSSEITVDSKDETGQLLSALRDMNSGLVNIVSQVRSGTSAIAIASAQIATGNLDLSGRTEEQASSLEETASAMEQITSAVNQNADNSRQGNQMAVSASDLAIEGGKVVSGVIDTMVAISTSSRKIVDIISVIDGIAFQTNILALNAAVEAARAGEQGRGFAVVASEVRSLAQRSAAAAKEIKALIDDSVIQVGNGTTLVQQAGATMAEVVASIKRVSDIVAEINAASQEQSSGIQEVNLAITQMDDVTQQNAALVEEAAAAAASLRSQASELEQVVSIFKLSPSWSESPPHPHERTTRDISGKHVLGIA